MGCYFERGRRILRTKLCLLVAIVSMLLLCACVNKIYPTVPADRTTTPALTQDVSENGRIESNQEQIVTSGNAVQAQQTPIVFLPDLVPTEIIYDTSELHIGQEIYFDSSIRNDGNVDSTEFNINWFVNDVSKGYGGHQGVLAGSEDSTYNSQFYWTPTGPGTYTIEFAVDCDDFIAESNEENNSAFITIIVPVAD